MYGGQLPTTGVSWLIYGVIGVGLLAASAVAGLGRLAAGLIRR